MAVLVRLILSLFALGSCLWPTWVFLGVRFLTSPEGFWQNLLLVGLGLWVLGSIQFFFLAVLLAVLVAIWSS